ncbi:hypothetical protein [Citrobacter amalonaticus]|uniref:hypothetical protein n=1 Tax=Citrobacter amalonaticus TaxID=35703 RepID=UPI000F66D514|nr:hypothetical protein [Citrobacter amalonaticus]
MIRRIKAQGSKQVSCAVPTLLIVKERYGMASAVQRRAGWVVIGFGLFAVDDQRLPRVFIFVNTLGIYFGVFLLLN